MKNVLRGQIDEAIRHLTSEPTDFDEAIHEMRLSCKRIRAVLRLIRHTLDEDIYCQENQRFRMLSKPYNNIRDAGVLLNTVQVLKNHYAQNIIPGIFYEIEQIFQNRYHHIASQDHGVTTTITQLKEGGRRLQATTINGKGWDIIGPGLKVTYQRGQREFQKSLAFPSARRLHEWRKQTKYLVYQLQLLRKIFPKSVKLRLKEFAHLGQMLGDHHDLAVLRSTILLSSFRVNQKAKQVLLTVIEIHTSQLRDEIFKLGQSLYQDTPKNFIQEIEKYWKS
jgi:CHAD domain-containing protein